MGFARVLSIGLLGVQGHVVEVEADIAQGLPTLVITGLPDTSLGEARDRLRAAIANSGQRWPSRRITINLCPATLPKHGSSFDLAMAICMLCAADVVPRSAVERVALLGELGLDGRIRAVRGVLPAVLAAKRGGVRRVIVPVANVMEARLIPGMTVIGADSLAGLVAYLNGEGTPAEPEVVTAVTEDLPSPDLLDVVGQDLGRRAVEIAAAGGHHLVLYGPPGSGKTMLAERLPGLLPHLDPESALEVTAVHSVSGTLPAGSPLVQRPPFQAPHHTASAAALVGGGSGLARPGALSLAHCGVLFLDEAPEFHTGVLDALRQPLERGEVALARSGGTTVYPARIQLVLAANPCPCATPSTVDCSCTPMVRRRYLGRLSGPLLDRVDLRVHLLPVRMAALMDGSLTAESSETVAARVLRARTRAAARWEPHGWRTNADVPGKALRTEFRLSRSVRASLDRQLEKGSISARGYDRILRVSWTLADLGERVTPDAADVAEALDLRMGNPS